MQQHKFFFGFFILLVFILTACESSKLNTFTLESSVGTYQQQLEVGSTTTQTGTVFIVKLKTASGNLVQSDASITITGPQGWNADAPATFTYPAGSYWAIAPEVAAIPVTGTYEVAATLTGSTFTQDVTLSDASQQLGVTELSATFSPKTENTVDVEWSPVANAQGYYLRLFDGATGSQVAAEVYTTKTSEQITTSQIDERRTYVVAVYSTSIDTVVDDPTLPEQFNMSDSVAVVTAAETDADFLNLKAPERDSLSVR